MAKPFLLFPAPRVAVDRRSNCGYIGFMHAVGLRDLKSRFSEYVRRVRSGEVLLVTDHGKVVAELRPPSASVVAESAPSGLLELARRGSVSLGAPNDPQGYPRLERVGSPGLAMRLLDEERGDH